MSEIRRIVVVGGGTAGWLTAAKLAKQFSCAQSRKMSVTLIESPDVATVGVGEGTWPTMRKTLAELGIPESLFMRECHAAFKQGTRFDNWKENENEGVNTYYHLFSSVCDASEFNLSAYWALGGRDQPYAYSVSPQASVCDAALAPKLITHRDYEGVLNYAYHLDAAKFASLLTRHATEKLGVRHISANVNNVRQDKDGFITAVDTASGVVEGDFFVDCTGFKSLLIGETFQIPFIPVNDSLLTNHAVAIQVPYDNEEARVASTTIATAKEAGWIWDIGLASRRGTGFVYSDDFISHDDAEATLRQYIGDDDAALTARRIPMKCGYRKTFWENNCVAIGLSAAFVEPLEASAIFLIEAAANMLCEQLPGRRSLLPAVSAQFNASFSFRWQRTIEFIKLHYVLSQRQGDFWQANRELSTIPEGLADKLARWQFQPVSRYDFPHVFEPFPQDSYQYVLHGMGFNEKMSLSPRLYTQHATAERWFTKAEAQRQACLTNLPGHRELLKKVALYGFQKS